MKLIAIITVISFSLICMGCNPDNPRNVVVCFDMSSSISEIDFQKSLNQLKNVFNQCNEGDYIKVLPIFDNSSPGTIISIKKYESYPHNDSLKQEYIDSLTTRQWNIIVENMNAKYFEFKDRHKYPNQMSCIILTLETALTLAVDSAAGVNYLIYFSDLLEDCSSSELPTGGIILEGVKKMSLNEAKERLIENYHPKFNLKEKFNIRIFFISSTSYYSKCNSCLNRQQVQELWQYTILPKIGFKGAESKIFFGPELPKDALLKPEM